MSGFSQADVDRHNARVAAGRGVKVETSSQPVTEEGELHDQIEAECIRRRWYYVHFRMDKPHTAAPGTPDFIIAMAEGVTVWVEAKAKGGKLSQEQFTAMHVLKALGHFHTVVYSFADFLEYVNSYAKI